MIRLALLAFVAFAEVGCSKSSPSDHCSLSVSPQVLDFGKVRPMDSPIKLDFEIFNHGDKSVTITDILSGCSCTVVDLPHEPIPPKGRAAATLRVNLLGRFGLFENELVIKTVAEPPLRVTVRGNIETDIWANGQSLRCAADPKEQHAFAFLTIYTAKYPDIVFADTLQEEGITLSEISRFTTNGETSIRFSVEVDTKGKAAIARTIHIAPQNPSISPLTIPLYCYRENEEM